MQPPFTLYTFPQSPWSHKARSVLKYKEIAFTEVPQDLMVRQRVLKPLVGPQTGPVLVGADGGTKALTDSTAIALWAEEFAPEHSILHPDPGMEVVSRLLEEMIDEWVSRAYLHLRWHNAADRKRNTDHVLRLMAPQVPGFLRETLIAPRFVKPMLEALPRLGVTEEMGPILVRSLKRFLTILEPIHFKSDCLLGPSPVLADFAAVSLLGHMVKDPAGEMMIIEEFAELCAYLNQMEANITAGVERRDAWAARSHPNTVDVELISQLLSYMAHDFFAYHLANVAALSEGRNEVAAELPGGDVYKAPASAYQRGQFRLLLEKLNGARSKGIHLLLGKDSEGEKALYGAVGRLKKLAGARELLSGLDALLA